MLKRFSFYIVLVVAILIAAEGFAAERQGIYVGSDQYDDYYLQAKDSQVSYDEKCILAVVTLYPKRPSEYRNLGYVFNWRNDRWYYYLAAEETYSKYGTSWSYLDNPQERPVTSSDKVEIWNNIINYCLANVRRTPLK